MHGMYDILLGAKTPRYGEMQYFSAIFSWSFLGCAEWLCPTNGGTKLFMCEFLINIQGLLNQKFQNFKLNRHFLNLPEDVRWNWASAWSRSNPSSVSIEQHSPFSKRICKVHISEKPVFCHKFYDSAWYDSFAVRSLCYTCCEAIFQMHQFCLCGKR